MSELTTTITHHSVRTLGISLSHAAIEPGTPMHDRLREKKAQLYEAINRYVERFAATENSQCVCGMPLGGLLGMFTYGIRHGEGRCDACRHPARANHYIELEGFEEPVLSWTQPLPYHPDYVTERTEGDVP